MDSFPHERELNRMTVRNVPCHVSYWLWDRKNLIIKKTWKLLFFSFKTLATHQPLVANGTQFHLTLPPPLPLRDSAEIRVKMGKIREWHKWREMTESDREWDNGLTPRQGDDICLYLTSLQLMDFNYNEREMSRVRGFQQVWLLACMQIWHMFKYWNKYWHAPSPLSQYHFG